MNSISGKKIILGISGSIAAYKGAELLRLLKTAGADVRVVLTQGGAAFISPLTFQALSGQPVHTHLLDATSEAAMDHISLAKWADLILIAPASANCIAHLANGFADDLLSTLCLATKAQIAIAPAMNQAMWHHPLTQKNQSALVAQGVLCWGPAAGEQACGDEGFGRLLEPIQLFEQVEDFFSAHTEKLLAGKSVVITAGPTREAIDPVRYLTNHSSGKMGYAIAQAAQQAGAHVTLISGPVNLPKPNHVQCIEVTSAQEMLSACQQVCPSADIFIATAAVADYCLAEPAAQKLKKNGSALTLTLEPTPDILATISQQTKRPFCVGFAAETQQLEQYAQDKLIRKNLDMIVANDVSDSTIGFQSDYNAATIFDRTGNKKTLPHVTKSKMAQQLIAIIAQQLHH